MTSRVTIDPRRLDKRVRVEVSTITKGASGGMVKAWSLVGVRWAGISGKAGMKQSATDAGGDVPEATHVITMHYLAGVTATTHRIKHGAQVFEILHVHDVLAQGVRMDLLCRTGVSDG